MAAATLLPLSALTIMSTNVPLPGTAATTGMPPTVEVVRPDVVKFMLRRRKGAGGVSPNGRGYVRWTTLGLVQHRATPGLCKEERISSRLRPPTWHESLLLLEELILVYINPQTLLR